MIGLKDVIIWTISLVIIVAVDYFHTIGASFVSSAVPMFIFQICMMINAKCKKMHNKGIIEYLIDYFKSEE